MKDCVVLFLYHRKDALTLKHFKKLKETNPDLTVIPACHGLDNPIQNSVRLEQFASPWSLENKWEACDALLYLWYLNSSVRAERYVVIEYDVYVNQPIRDAYRSVWEADIACHDYYLFERGDQWFHFRHVNKLPPNQRPFAAGIVPLAGMLISNKALDCIVKTVCRENIFCELRLGTAANLLNLNVKQFSPPLSETLNWNLYFESTSQEGIYHSIKDDRTMREGRRKNKIYYRLASRILRPLKIVK